MQASTRLQARLSARETLHWTDSVPKLCLPIRKRMPSMSCWLTLPVTTFRAMRMTYRSISTRKCSTTVMSFIRYRVSSGEIDADSNPIKTYIDTFPAGTLSGAPKVRAMQLITDIEKHNRGAYGGCIGFIGFDGDLNQAITIRTFVSRGNVLYYQAGAGIVAKSNDERNCRKSITN